MKQPHSSHSAQGGMMLLEVLVAVLIFAIGLLGTVALHARAVQNTIGSEDRTRASLLANELATYMWTQSRVELTTDKDKQFVAAWQARVKDPKKDGLPNANVNVVPKVDASGAEATITITWIPVTAKDPTTNDEQNTVTTRVVL